jgi:hypothetical protein
VSSRPLKRVHNVEMYVDRDARPGWISGAERIPGVGEEVFCAGGQGEIAAVLGRTGDGSRLLEVRLPDPKAKPFFAAASNVLVTPVPVSREDESGSENGSSPTAVVETGFWLR